MPRVNQMLHLADLFSGIGCFSYAFHGVFKTSMYCEIDQTCRDVLKSNMRKRLIDSAIIRNDIRTLRALDVDIVCAGFPCQDLSSANQYGKGLNGSRSGLFFEIVRLLESSPRVSHVFLENVPVLIKSWDTIVHEMKRVGFVVKYVYVTAEQVGAPHLRRRVFIYARRRGVKILKDGPVELVGNWERMPPMSVTYNSRGQLNEMYARHKMCGNAIVPLCIAAAYNNLIHGVPLPQSASYIENILVDNDMVVRKHRFNTPSASFLIPSRHLSKRGVGLLANNVKFNKKNKLKNKPNATMNPVFVEWLMGLPPNYTTRL